MIAFLINLSDNVNMEKIYSAEKIAEYFINKAKNEGRVITNKKLQKLIYYSQAWNLALRDKPLFKEDIEAWIHGPVVSSVYRKYKKFGYHNIIQEHVDEINLTNEDDKFLNNIWQVYGTKDADYLELLTHSEPPWQMAREGIETNKNSSKVISHQSMKDFYRSLLKSKE